MVKYGGYGVTVNTRVCGSLNPSSILGSRPMKILGEIKGDFIFQNELVKLRQAVRVVLFDENKKIAVNHYLPREGYTKGEYNLPGGGVKENETIEEALIREVLEETGCNIKNIQELGVIKEYGVGKENKHNQDTYCFVAEVDGEKGNPKFTEREKEDLLEINWMAVGEVLEKIKNQDGSFSKTRNLIILEEIINLI